MRRLALIAALTMLALPSCATAQTVPPATPATTPPSPPPDPAAMARLYTGDPQTVINNLIQFADTAHFKRTSPDSLQAGMERILAHYKSRLDSMQTGKLPMDSVKLASTQKMIAGTQKALDRTIPYLRCSEDPRYSKNPDDPVAMQHVRECLDIMLGRGGSE